ncbi:glycosyltransferase [Cupriavidus sp. BIC8F]|uniref:glycosyltransferase n=1 Tax=Cupriavidus sp. BIC8F TaxID=3079014 RepID=UPI00291670B1|nr:glycosyltransferase [Cupriavidus sp. BIC8F]
MQQSISPELTVSIVSHGQADLLPPLLAQLAALRAHLSLEVILTENLGPYRTRRFDELPLSIDYIVNEEPKGFGANHNAAFARAAAPYFCVMNPDIRLQGDPFGPLVSQLRAAKGVAGPKVVNPSGGLEDSARHVPTLARLLGRHLKGIRGADYKADRIQSVDWMAGMCLVFDADAYRMLGGFDEGFHLYCEDVDICLRAHLAGWNVSWTVDAVVEHAARRDSRRKPRYLWWHLRSFARLIASPTYRNFCWRSSHGARSVI